MIEETVLLTGSLGRSVRQALFEVGTSAPVEIGPAFAAAHRVWLVSTDFAATIAVLKARLADATADGETLLVAHKVGAPISTAPGRPGRRSHRPAAGA